jgi:hypothetical protein
MKTTMLLSVFLAAALVGFSAGTSRGAETADAAAPPPPAKIVEGGNSPEEVFDRAKVAAEQGDTRGFFQLLPPDTRVQIGFVMVTGARMAISMKAAMTGSDAAPAEKKLTAMLKRHGVRDLPVNAHPIDLDDEESVIAAARYMFSGVDVVALIEELQGFMSELGFGGGHSGVKTSPGLEDAELTNLKIDGDRATATVGNKPGTFVRVNGRWYLEPESDASQD